MNKPTKRGRKPTKLKTKGGRRSGSGRPKGSLRGRKLVKQIQINLDTYNLLKELKGDKSWSSLLEIMIEKSSKNQC